MAVIGGIFAALTILLIPVVVASQVGAYPITRLYWHREFWIWAGAVFSLGAAAGFLSGSARATALFGHLWGTEQPRQEFLTVTLWLLLLGFSVATYYMVN
jgi:hypothetical protein